YERLAGISTLAGAGVGGGERAAPSALARGAARLGGLAVGGLGNLCALVAEGWERIVPTGARPRIGAGSLRLVFFSVAGFLTLPTLLVVPASFTGGTVVELPPNGLSLRWYATYLASAQWMGATANSFVIATAAGLLALVIGAMAAFALVRRRVPGKTALIALILSPLIIPRVVIAVALFYLYARIDLVGSITGLVIGHAVLAVPYVVITVMAVLSTYDQRYDLAANTLGASPWQTLW